MTQSEDLGRECRPTILKDRVRRGNGELNGGVYSDGPRNVYNRLTNGPNSQGSSQNLSTSSNNIRRKVPKFPTLTSKSMRTINLLASNRKPRKQPTNSSQSISRPQPSEQEVESQQFELNNEGVTRNHPSRFRKGKNLANSLSSAGSILCCSSINSSDVRNCNKKFLQKYEYEVASKVWQGALELGVEGEEEEERYVERIISNENRVEAARILREQHNKSHP
ncbi:hypothetical protein A2U01_0001699 [Trifolium medium]|uniref:Uncharacterized protein n=1 Tax=Trifolium medium TaxID=97028 RepID=A0A392M1N5_9FABA|nr:hypothetical protein [Trifolium medium]